MIEYIDIVTKEGVVTGSSASKSEIHTKGYYHNTAHVWLYTKNREILLAQRAASKQICPLLWDVSVAGHVDAGESVETAAIRETQEEISLNIGKNELYKIGVFECFQSYSNGIIDNEFHHTFIVELKKNIQDLEPQENEVEALKLVSFNAFENFLEDNETNNHFIKSNKAYYLLVLKAIKQKLESH